MISLAYAFPATSPSPGTTTETVTLNVNPIWNIIGGNLSYDCLSSVPHALLLPGYNSTVSDNTTVPLNETNANSTNIVIGVSGNATMPTIEPYANVTLTANGTTTIAGQTYWYVTFIPIFASYGEFAYITFQGVLFRLSSVVQYEYSGRDQWYSSTSNGTMVRVDEKISVSEATALVAQTSSGSPCTYFLPSFTVEWGGFHSNASNIQSWENYNQAAIELREISRNQTSVMGQEIINFPFSLDNPWFTQHVDPQAGVSYQVDGGEITLYVRTS